MSHVCWKGWVPNESMGHTNIYAKSWKTLYVSCWWQAGQCTKCNDQNKVNGDDSGQTNVTEISSTGKSSGMRCMGW